MPCSLYRHNSHSPASIDSPFSYSIAFVPTHLVHLALSLFPFALTMGRLSDLFSVNCCFITIIILGIALAIPILWPGPNQAIINACQKKEYRKIHTLVAEALERINTERRHQAKLKGEAFIQANVDDIDFGVRNQDKPIAFTT